MAVSALSQSPIIRNHGLPKAPHLRRQSRFSQQKELLVSSGLTLAAKASITAKPDTNTRTAPVVNSFAPKQPYQEKSVSRFPVRCSSLVQRKAVTFSLIAKPQRHRDTTEVQ